MFVAIHQPEHLPWLGFLDKARQVDTFVLLDHVQFRKGYFQNRNRVRSGDGALWLTVPVQVGGRFGQPITDVAIDNRCNPRWRDKSMKTLESCYRQAPHFDRYATFVADLYGREWTRLVELNEHVIRAFFDFFEIDVTVVRSSDLALTGSKGDLLLAICRALGADRYLSGVSGREYLDVATFEEQGIGVEFQQFHHPIYRQFNGPFIPCLSALDLLFNHGGESPRVLRGVGVDVLSEVFA